MKVADLTLEELEAVVRRLVDEALAEHNLLEVTLEDEQALWAEAGLKHLASLYSRDEPDYSQVEIKPWR